MALENRLTVRTERAASARQTAERVRQGFARNPFLSADEISVEVQDGTARLIGTVFSSFERSVADDVAARTAGIVAVDNELHIRAPRYLTPYDPSGLAAYPYDRRALDIPPEERHGLADREIEARIRSGLFWSSLVDAGHINVRVVNGVATLEGNVRSRAEMMAALNNAYQAGALRVENQLRLPPSTP